MQENSMVLIVDDDRIQRIIMTQLFKKAGIEACSAANGEEALQKMARQSFSYMVTDLNMPRMNGLDLAKKAKSLAPQMLIALCTGDDSHDVERVTVDSGIEAVFTKPVNYSDLLKMVIEKA